MEPADDGGGHQSTLTGRFTEPSKRGPKKGAKQQHNKTINQWFIACKTFSELPTKMTYSKFLKSEASGPAFTGTKAERVSFGQRMNEFKAGTLKFVAQEETQRRRPGLYPDVEEKLVKCLQLRAKSFQRDKCGTSWACLMGQKLLGVNVIG